MFGCQLEGEQCEMRGQMLLGDKRDRLLAGDKRAMESWRPAIRPSLALFSPPRSPRLRVIISNPTRAEARRRSGAEAKRRLKG